MRGDGRLPRGRALPGDGHTAAIVRAYALVEAAQVEAVAGEVEAAAAEAAAQGWEDVQVLVHYARSFVARFAGLDDTAHLEAMVEVSGRIEDPALYALALAHTATRRIESRRALELAESPISLLVRAVGLLDGSRAPVPHRAAALIQVAIVSHALGLWELARERYELIERVFAADDDPRWASTVRRQRRAVAYNRVDLALDWASAEAMIGDWDAAEARAAAILPGSLEAVDADWPPGVLSLYRCELHLLAALAGPRGGAAYSLGRYGPQPFTEVPAPLGADLAEAVAAVAEAIRAARSGDDARAARLAAGHADRLGVPVSANARLLCMSIAAREPGVPAATIAYAGELATLRWNTRIDQMTAVRDAIAVERRRREHEQLRHQILVDELTGLTNRRGYNAYLNGLLQLGGEHNDDVPGEYTIMMIDVDHFKGVNDTFGHDVGDIVLTRIAQVLAANVRPVDLAARLGGDEFVVILAGTHPGVPETRAEAILDAVRGHPWEEIAAGLAVSVSIGVHHGGRRELPTLLADADRKLYDAKKGGRGRVVGPDATPGEWPTYIGPLPAR